MKRVVTMNRHLPIIYIEKVLVQSLHPLVSEKIYNSLVIQVVAEDCTTPIIIGRQGKQKLSERLNQDPLYVEKKSTIVATYAILCIVTLVILARFALLLVGPELFVRVGEPKKILA